MTPRRSVVLLSLIAAGTGAMAGCLEAGAADAGERSEIRTLADGADWAQLGRTPRHTSYNPLETAIGVETVARVQPVWTCCERGRRMDVAVWQGQAFVTNADPPAFPPRASFSFVSAFDAISGAELWEAPIGQGGELGGVSTMAAVGYGRLFAQDENRFFGLSTTAGAFAPAPHGFPGFDWSISSPVASRRAVYFDAIDLAPGDRRSLHAYGDDGAPLWSRALEGRPREPAIANERIWTVVGDRGLQAFALATGEPLWATAPVDGVLGSPSISGGRVYAVSYPHTLYAYQETTRALLWTATHTGGANLANPPPPPPPAVDDRNVYVAVDKVQGGIALGAFDAVTGARRFSVIVGTSRRSGLLAVANGIVYVPSEDGRLYALDRGNGRVVATFRFGGPVRSPAVVDGRIYVPTQGAGMTVLGLVAP